MVMFLHSNKGERPEDVCVARVTGYLVSISSSTHKI